MSNSTQTQSLAKYLKELEILESLSTTLLNFAQKHDVDTNLLEGAFRELIDTFKSICDMVESINNLDKFKEVAEKIETTMFNVEEEVIKRVVNSGGKASPILAEFMFWFRAVAYKVLHDKFVELTLSRRDIDPLSEVIKSILVSLGTLVSNLEALGRICLDATFRNDISSIVLCDHVTYSLSTIIAILMHDQLARLAQLMNDKFGRKLLMVASSNYALTLSLGWVNRLTALLSLVKGEEKPDRGILPLHI